MRKAYKVYLNLVQTEWFIIMVHKNISVYFTVTSIHETSKFLPQTLLWGLFLNQKKLFHQSFLPPKLWDSYVEFSKAI